MTQKIKFPRDLQLNDNFYIINAAPMDDHKGDLSVSRIKYYSLVKEQVTGLEFDEKDDRMVIIKGKTFMEGTKIKVVYTVPGVSTNTDKFGVGDVIADEQVAFEAITRLAYEELDKANKIKETAEKVVKGVEDNIKALEKSNPSGSRSSSYRSGSRRVGLLISETSSDEDSKEAPKSEIDD